MSSEINTAFPAAPQVIDLRIVDATGEVKETRKITVKRFRTGDLPKIIKAMAPLQKELVGLAQKSEEDVTAIFFSKAEECMDFVAVVSGIDRAVLDDTDPEDAVNLFVTVLEVNLDFFAKRIVPAIVGALRRLKDAWTVRSGAVAPKGTGVTSSTSSSPPDTGATPS